MKLMHSPRRRLLQLTSWGIFHEIITEKKTRQMKRIFPIFLTLVHLTFRSTLVDAARSTRFLWTCKREKCSARCCAHMFSVRDLFEDVSKRWNGKECNWIISRRSFFLLKQRRQDGELMFIFARSAAITITISQPNREVLSHRFCATLWQMKIYNLCLA